MDPIEVIYSAYQMKMMVCWIFLAAFLTSAIICINIIHKSERCTSDAVGFALIIGAIGCLLTVVTMMGMNPSQDLIRVIAVMNATICQ